MALSLMQPALAERTIGSTFTLTAEDFNSCRQENGTTFNFVVCSDNTQQPIRNSTQLNLNAFLYWIRNAPSTPVAGYCIIEFIDPTKKYYPYSIDLPFNWSVSGGATSAYYTIESEKVFINSSAGLVGEAVKDLDYDGDYKFTLYGSGGGVICQDTLSFVIDRTSEFETKKALLVGFVILSMFGIAFYIVRFGDKLQPAFQVMVNAISFLFIYSGLSLMLLAEREYLKLSSISQNLETTFVVTVYAAMLISMLVLAYFIFNIINNSIKSKRL